jgi:ABC-type Fe3+-hydroxamate transport system substrate-binding protein
MNLEENLARHAEAIAEFAPVFVTEPKAVTDVPAMIRQLGQIHRCESAAEALANEIERELAQPPAGAFTFACPIWKNPWMWCGGDTYVSQLIAATGGQNVLQDRERYPSLEVEEVLARKPDVIFLPDEPFVFTAADAAAISRRVIGPFPGHLVTWHGVRTLAGLRYLRAAVSSL